MRNQILIKQTLCITTVSLDKGVVTFTVTLNAVILKVIYLVCNFFDDVIFPHVDSALV